MDVWLEINGRYFLFEGPTYVSEIREKIYQNFNFSDFYLSLNGNILDDDCKVDNGYVRATLRLRGGKGGFGSMLRAIGAQIEKTTNREACRDLSGRRLRDINEEKRLKNWIAQQAEREREAAERRKKKLERLCVEPKHDFSDQSYEKERSELTEKVYDAVEQGFRSASTSSSCPKRKLETNVKAQKKKKTCLWVDDIDENDLSSLESSDSESEGTSRQIEKSHGDMAFKDCTQCENKDAPSMSQAGEPSSNDVSSTSQAGEPSEDVPSTSQAIAPSEDVPSTSQAVAPSEDVPSTSQAVAPSEDVPSTSRAVAPSEDVLSTSQTVAPSEDVPSTSPAGSHPEDVPSAS